MMYARACIHTYVHMYMCAYELTVTPVLSETGLSENLIYLTLHCESPPPLCVQFTLIYPTSGLSDTFYEEQMWSDKRGPTVLNMYSGPSFI